MGWAMARRRCKQGGHAVAAGVYNGSRWWLGGIPVVLYPVRAELYDSGPPRVCGWGVEHVKTMHNVIT